MKKSFFNKYRLYSKDGKIFYFILQNTRRKKEVTITSAIVEVIIILS